MSSSPNSSSSSEPLVAATVERASTPHFSAFLDVRCPVRVVLGTGRITVRQCLALARQSVLRLEQAAGEDLSVHVNDVAVARGEVVIVDDSTAIRLTEITPAAAAEGRS